MSLTRSILESADVTRIGWTLIHSFWQCALIAALLAVALLILRRRNSQSRYVAGCVAMGLMGILPVVTFAMWKPAKSPEIAQTTTLQTPTEIERTNVDRPIPPATEAELPKSVQPKPESGAAHILPWLVIAWGAGVAVMSIWNLGGWISLQRLKSADTKPVSRDIEQRLANLRARIGLQCVVRIAESIRVRSPLVIGAFKPIILLPATVLFELPAAQLESILAHELAHICRHDYLVNLLQCVIETLLFYHPATWWISRVIRIERENCCDDIAVALTQDRSTYAQALAAIAGNPSPAMAVAADGGALLSRVRRIIGLPDPRARRSGGWAAGAMGLVAFLIFAMWIATPQRTRAQATKPDAPRTFAIAFFDPATNDPTPGVEGIYWFGVKKPADPKTFQTDSHGHITLPLETDARTITISYHKDGFTDGTKVCGNTAERSDAIPESFDVRLKRNNLIGGHVVDEQNQPLADVTIRLDMESSNDDSADRTSMRSETVTTDRNGRWSYDRMTVAPSLIDVYVQDPDASVGSRPHWYRPPEFEDLYTLQMVSQIHRGFTVKGTVVNEAGQPVDKPEITPTQFSMDGRTIGDDAGRFNLRGVAPGKARLLARAEGYAPQVMNLDVTRDMAPVIFHLTKGRRVHGQFVDAKGVAIARGMILAEQWQSVPRLGLFWNTDANGQFEWNGAPLDEFTLSGRDFKSQRPVLVKVLPGVTEVTLTTLAPATLQGRVVYDETSEPAGNFKVTVTSRSAALVSTKEWKSATADYEVADVTPADTYRVRIDAAGYRSVESGNLKAIDDVVHFDARLKKSDGISSTLLTAEGNPAEGADILLMNDRGPELMNGRMRPRPGGERGEPTTSDAAGHFVLPERPGDQRVLAIHDTGWSFVRFDAPAKFPKEMKLRAWCTLEGIATVDGKPVVNQTISLEPAQRRRVDNIGMWGFRYETQTDESGRFKLTRVADGAWEIGVRYNEPDGNGRTFFRWNDTKLIQLSPGDNRSDLRIGGPGRVVTGKVLFSAKMQVSHERPMWGTLTRVKPELAPPTGWEKLTRDQRSAARDAFEAGDAMRAYDAQIHVYTFEGAADGSFRSTPVAAGTYDLSFEFQQPSAEMPMLPERAAFGQKRVIVPAADSESFNVGTVQMADVNHPKPGDDAPDFSLKSFDGAPLKLADYRGKVILLHFWWASSEGAVAQLPTVMKLHADYATDSRFVVISLSSDESVEAARTFAASHQMSWPQASVNTDAGGALKNALGVWYATAFVLIGPDGKILKTQLRENELRPAIDAALPGAAR